MSRLIAYCGLDCEKCNARIATINNDDALREKTAELWTKLNGVEITKEMINCVGCTVDDVKTLYCDGLCPIRQCVMAKGYKNCGECQESDTCKRLAMITSNNKEAKENLLHE